MFETLHIASNARTPRSFVIGCIGILAASAACALSVGCASSKAVDTTRLVEHVTAGERNVQAYAVPGEFYGEPGTNLVVPTTPGKNLKVRINYPDGTLKAEVDASRSDVLDALLAGVSAIDAAKFIEAAAERDFTLAIIDRALAAIPVIQGLFQKAAAQNGTAGTDRVSLRDELVGLLRDPQARAALRELLGIRDPDPRPASPAAPLPAGGVGTAPGGLGTIIDP